MYSVDVNQRPGDLADLSASLVQRLLLFSCLFGDLAPVDAALLDQIVDRSLRDDDRSRVTIRSTSHSGGIEMCSEFGGRSQPRTHCLVI